MPSFSDLLRQFPTQLANLDAALAECAKPLPIEVMKWTCDEDGNWFQRPAHEIDGKAVPQSQPSGLKAAA